MGFFQFIFQNVEYNGMIYLLVRLMTIIQTSEVSMKVVEEVWYLRSKYHTINVDVNMYIVDVTDVACQTMLVYDPHDMVPKHGEEQIITDIPHDQDERMIAGFLKIKGFHYSSLNQFICLL